MSGSLQWSVIAGLCVVTAAVKAAGPIAFGGRALPVRLAAVIALLPAALLSALVVTGTFVDDGRLVLAPPAAGAATAAVIVWRGGSIIWAVLAAAAVAAAIRLV